MFDGAIEEAAAKAQQLLATIAPGAVCVPQAWDRRVDCILRLPDGSFIGEMVSVGELTEERIRATGERLRKRGEGIDVPLVNELQSPIKIVPTVTLWRPVGPEELKLIEASGMKRFPPRLPEQPIFYPVTTEEYATKIARDWNVPASGSGFVTRFEVHRDFLKTYDAQDAGGQAHREYWIPAKELDAFNDAIVGSIEIVRSFP